MTTITAQNGRLPASALTAVRTGQRLTHRAAGSYNRLDAAMRSAGQGALTLSAGLSGYRTLADQQHMRNLGLTTIAVGRSPHGEGVAADWQGLGGLTGARYRWLRANAGPFGWFHPTWAQAGGVNPSPHHWEYDHRRDTGPHPGPGDDDMTTPEDVYVQASRAVANVLRAPEFQGMFQRAPWSNPMTALVGGEGGWVAGPTPVQGFIADIFATVVSMGGQVAAIATELENRPRYHLHGEDVEAIAQRVAEILDGRHEGHHDHDREDHDREHEHPDA